MYRWDGSDLQEASEPQELKDVVGFTPASDLTSGFIKRGWLEIHERNWGFNRKITEVNSAFPMAIFDYRRVCSFLESLVMGGCFP